MGFVMILSNIMIAYIVIANDDTKYEIARAIDCFIICSPGLFVCTFKNHLGMPVYR